MSCSVLRRLRRDPITLYNSPKEGCSEVGTRLFQALAFSKTTQRNGLKVRQGKFRLNMRNLFFTLRVVRHWNNLPREVVDSPGLEMFKRCLDLSDLLWFQRNC